MAVQQPITFYSNVVNVKTTPTEVIFEFAAVFPEQAAAGKAIHFNPEMRVIMGLPAMKALLEVLQKATTQMQATETSPGEPRIVKQ